VKEFSLIKNAIDDIRAGKMIIVVDDDNRENEGDFVMAAERVTPEAINFLSRSGRGLICTSMTADRLEALELTPMVNNNTALHGTRFTVSVDVLEGTSTGISAFDRCATIEKLIDPKAKPEDFGRPGHIFPIQALDGGVLARLYPSGVLCEIMDDDGNMARVPRLMEMAQNHDVRIITVADLIAYRRIHEKLVEKVTEVNFPTAYGTFKLHLYRSDIDEHHHLAVVKGDVAGKEDIMVRVHSQCLTGDVFGSLRCDCGDQLAAALEMIEKEGTGVLLYMRQEGRGIGLANKIKAYDLQDKGRDTVEANLELGFEPDLRDYGIGAQILKDLGLTTIRIITNNPRKLVGLEGHGLKITGRISIQVHPTEHNKRYLETKRDKLGHFLSIL